MRVPMQNELILMSSIIVSPLEKSEAAFRQHRPSHVVSILDNDEPTPPVFDTLPPENHIKLIENCSRPGGQARCETLIALAKSWDGAAPILIHCNKGVARSMAAAYILMCAHNDKLCEKAAAMQLRQAAPHADPNILLISEADALLGRDDRMIEAILDLCPCCGAIDAPVVVLPVAA